MAVLAIAVPAIGFGQEPAIIALILYGVLPILQGTLAGIAAVPASVLSVAEGMGMSAAAAGEGRTAAGRTGDYRWRANVRDNQHWYGNHRLDGRSQYAGNADHYRVKRV